MMESREPRRFALWAGLFFLPTIGIDICKGKIADRIADRITATSTPLFSQLLMRPTLKIEKTSSLRKLTRMGFELYVAKSYQRGKISLREAAKLLNLNLSETIDLLMETGIKGNIRAKDVLDSLKTLPS